MPRLTKEDGAGIQEFLGWVKQDDQYGPEVASVAQQMIEKLDEGISFVSEDIAWQAYCLVHKEELRKMWNVGRVGAAA